MTRGRGGSARFFEKCHGVSRRGEGGGTAKNFQTSSLSSFEGIVFEFINLVFQRCFHVFWRAHAFESISESHCVVQIVSE